MQVYTEWAKENWGWYDVITNDAENNVDWMTVCIDCKRQHQQ